MAKLLEYYSNVLSFCHWYFPGKFKNFLKQQKQPPEVFYKKGIFKNFAIFAEKHLCCILLQTFRQLPSGLQLYQKETPTQLFYSKYSKFLRTPILKNIWERLPWTIAPKKNCYPVRGLGQGWRAFFLGGNCPRSTQKISSC